VVMDVNVKVAVRCRPMSGKEIARGCTTIVEIANNSIVIHSPDTSMEDKLFAFDHVYDGNSSQQQVYLDLGQPIITQALDGFNGTIFAYGQVRVSIYVPVCPGSY
jgi:outer membrane protein assembly factor BamE (lipoprotein component of BamABCDE complex)